MEKKNGKEKNYSMFFTESEEEGNSWQKEWVDMPEFIQEDKESIASVVVHFESEEDMKLFSELIGVTITKKTKGIFYPPKKAEKRKVYVDEP